MQPKRTIAALPLRYLFVFVFLLAASFSALGQSSGPSATNPTSTASTMSWQPVGPSAVTSPNYGPITGRIASIAIDPADPTGNRVFVGTTGGGVWLSPNANASDPVSFFPVSDQPSGMSSTRVGSITIGAITVQPGGTKVVLAGTGDGNDGPDSYYGTGILRSTDDGNTWSVITDTADHIYSFQGEGFAGFAWSDVNPQLVVAAVAQAYEGTLVNAQLPGVSYAGLYYSTDAGATWNLATITDSSGNNVEGAGIRWASPNGNSATAVVWNPIRHLFIAAVRFHGYYQSADGITWTRIATQPGAGLSQQACPTYTGTIGSTSCPIFRGALAVNPITGDTFAWTVDISNQDQGLWQDLCLRSGDNCGNRIAAFTQKWSTAQLYPSGTTGSTKIAQGDYTLSLAAIPSVGGDTLLLAGDDDLWKCTLSTGCSWRNTTNTASCQGARVAPFQHAIAWNPSDPSEIFVGNDSGLWRSNDSVGVSGDDCSPNDASHFQNLNSGLGPLAEIKSLAQVGDSPYTLLAGLAMNGTAGVKSTSGPTESWPQILAGYGGPVAIDPTDSSNWYINAASGVSIYRCSQQAACTPDSFGTSPVVDDTDVSGDGITMPLPAPFIVDPLDSSQLLVGTYRIWRGAADGANWTSANAISPILDSNPGPLDAVHDDLIRTIAAMPVTGGEVIYAGMYGAEYGSRHHSGHVFKSVFNPESAATPAWQDVATSPVVNGEPFNSVGFDISSIFIDPQDATGNTVYVTVAGTPDFTDYVRTVYRTTDGGADWYDISSNLPKSPANSIVIDPQDRETAYVATDDGVYSTRQVSTCANDATNCWSVFGANLPYAPVQQLIATPPTASPNVLLAGTYGRGIWQIPLWTAGTQPTTASVDPASLAFGSQALGATSDLSVTIRNTGGIALVITSIDVSDGFAESSDCTNAPVNEGAACVMNVTFRPDQIGSISGQMVIHANVSGGEITIPLSGTGTSTGPLILSPGSLSFGQVQIGATSALLPITVENSSDNAIAVSSISVTPPFNLASNACGDLIQGNTDCALAITFSPTQAGDVTGTLTLSSGAGTQTVLLSGTGATAATDTLSPLSIGFPPTIVGQVSTAKTVTLSNDGDLTLLLMSAAASAGFNVSSNCGMSLIGHASCAISVSFEPRATGNISGTLNVSDVIRTQLIPLSGTALAPPVISVTPRQLDFATQPLTQPSAPATLTISNSGGAPMSSIGFQVTGISAGSFKWSANTCGATLNDGSSCTVQVVFTPSLAGRQTATLVISSSTLGVAAVQVPLSGIGQGPSGISISPANLSFTQPILGQSTAAQSVTIANTNTFAVTSLALAISPPFGIAQNTCGASLAANASCTASVVFTPTTNGVVTGTLTVSSSGFDNAATAVLAGAGGAAGSVQITPSSLNFPTTGVGTASSAPAVTLTNDGPVALANVALSASTGFRVVSTNCGASLEPAANCAAQIAFTPSAPGSQTGTLTIASPSLAASSQVALSGTGLDFSISPIGSTSQTVAGGQTATYTLSLAPLNGSTGTFTFACGSLPPNASCAFNPGSETIPANATANVIVQIATGRNAATAQNRTSSRTLFPVICFLIGAPLAFVRKRKTLLLLAILAVGLLGIASCAGSGGGSSGTQPPTSANNTPVGKYSVDVTATAAGVSHQFTLTLTVD